MAAGAAKAALPDKSHGRLANSVPAAVRMMWLTVKGSGCVPSGHPARPPRWLPKKAGGRRTPLSLRYGADNAPTDAERTSEADTLKGAGQPELTARRASVAILCHRSGAADTVSDQTNRGGSKRCRPPRFGVHVRGATGSISSGRRRSCDARRPPERYPFAALGVSDPFSSPTNRLLAVFHRR